jgi:hypothetical protein
MKRTEEQVLSKAPITVRLGDEDYKIQILTIRPSQLWRQKLIEVMTAVTNNFSGPSMGEAMSSGLVAALRQFPEKLLDLVLEYGPDLPKEKIFQEATEEQVARSFSAIMEVAFPFLPQLGMVLQLTRADQAPTSSRLQ